MDAYIPNETALLVIDPYNDFMSEGGKLYDYLKVVATTVGFQRNMRELMQVVRAVGVKVFIVPHHRAQGPDLETWKHVNASQRKADEMQLAAVGTWGGDWHPEFGPIAGDVIAQEHWGQSGFANTDLDALLKQNRMSKVIVAGMAAHTCVESTARFAMELGYHVTLVRDATSAYDDDSMRVAHEVTGPTFAHAILTTNELILRLQEQANRHDAESVHAQQRVPAALGETNDPS
jgi:nicotinamidase-related amidase